MTMYFLRDKIRDGEHWTKVKRISKDEEMEEDEISEMVVNHSPEEVKKQMRNKKVYIVR